MEAVTVKPVRKYFQSAASAEPVRPVGAAVPVVKPTESELSRVERWLETGVPFAAWAGWSTHNYETVDYVVCRGRVLANGCPVKVGTVVVKFIHEWIQTERARRRRRYVKNVTEVGTE